MYLAYALFCEGPSDYSYFEVLLPRAIESTGRREAARPRCSVRTLSSRATPSSKRVNQRRAAPQ